jgi:hypothetical protein
MALQSQAESAGGSLLRDVVVGVVEEVAPEERPLLDALSGFDDATALRRLTARDDRDQPLAFGVEAATALVTPLVWIALEETVRRIIDSTADRISKPKRGRARLFGRRRAAEPVIIPPLTTDQLRQVEQAVLDAACDAGFSQKRSERIADGVVRRLVLAPSQTER